MRQGRRTPPSATGSPLPEPNFWPGVCRKQGETVEEVVQRAAVHAKNEHHMKPTSGLVERIQGAIRDS
ncbi:MAG: DUF1059 domain-containing protein [Kiloniellaceae bacterium]|jgi:predicted small metal-binding protein|nr:DUF1059 domain-containing protein [Kiloniellaceae bacterium]